MNLISFVVPDIKAHLALLPEEITLFDLLNATFSQKIAHPAVLVHISESTVQATSRIPSTQIFDFNFWSHLQSETF
jgi:uncharacterized membrane protein